ncbi:helix-turn-helix domain-containing protein [Ereboglobus luteus]|nr:AraC family transcriptional regulator [Ereboglobus luteus]
MDLIRLFVDCRSPDFGTAYFGHLGFALAFHLIDGLARDGENETAPPMMDESRLRRVIDYIDGNLHARIAAHTLAGVACLSGTHFNRLFKNSTGMTAGEYVFEKRIRLAQALIRRGGMRIAEIAVAAGFCDQSHVDRRFRRYCQCSPVDFAQHGSFVLENGRNIQSSENKIGQNGGTL